MSKTFTTMRMVMREAAMDGLIGSNPLDLVRPPKRDTPEKRALPFDQVRRALSLLESLVRSGCPFVFKGGTALMLHLDTSRRLSIDVDIVCPPGLDI